MKPTALLFAVLLCAALLLAGCSGADIDNKDAIRTAIVEYLAANQAKSGLDPNAMDVTVLAVTFGSDKAQASVSFTIKGTSQGMQGNYTLERVGNKWGNVTRQNLTAAPHGLPEVLVEPKGVPLPPPSSNQLPAGHPTVPAK